MGQEKDEGWDMVYLENEKLKVAIQEKGAELTSIVKKGDTDGISVEWRIRHIGKDMRRYYFRL